uniref:Neuropeptide-like protein 31 n=1 Tax=Rhabditophanes sp. KR3021 TaxID=114890 RepID=A0AC35UF79_9BILA
MIFNFITLFMLLAAICFSGVQSQWGNPYGGGMYGGYGRGGYGGYGRGYGRGYGGGYGRGYGGGYGGHYGGWGRK